MLNDLTSLANNNDQGGNSAAYRNEMSTTPALASSSSTLALGVGLGGAGGERGDRESILGQLTALRSAYATLSDVLVEEGDALRAEMRALREGSAAVVSAQKHRSCAARDSRRACAALLRLHASR